MKNLLYVGLIVLGTLSMSSCGGEKAAESKETTSDTVTFAPNEEIAPSGDSLAPGDTTVPKM